MGDIRFTPYYARLKEADDPSRLIRDLSDEGVISALAAASADEDPYLANVLATEAMNRARQKHAIIHNAGEGMYVVDAKGRLRFMNPAAERMLGWPQAELLGQFVHDVIHPRDQEGHPVAAERCPLLDPLRSAVVVQRDGGEVFTRKDGSTFPVAFTAAPMTREDEVEGVIVVFRDVTEREAAEAQLKARAEQQGVVAEIGQYALTERDLDALMHHAAQAVMGTLHVTSCHVLELETTGRTFRVRATAGEPDNAFAAFRIPVAQGSYAEYTMNSVTPVVVGDLRTETRFASPTLIERGVVSSLAVRIPGDEKPFGVLSAHSRSARSFSADEILFLRSVASVLATAIARHRVEEQLAASEEQHRLLVKDVQDYAIFGMDPEGNVTSWNAGAERVKGYTADEILGAHFSRFHTAEDCETDLPRRLLERAERSGHSEVEGWRVRRDGSRYWAHTTITALRDEEGNLKGFSNVVRDLTERRRAEKALRDSEARTRAILEAALDAVVTIDADGRVVEFNPAAERMFGYTREETLGEEMAALIVPPRLRQAHWDGMAHYHETGEGPVLGHRVEMSAMRRDGTEFPVEIAIVRIPTDGPAVFTGYIRDITERKRAEDEHRDLHMHLERSVAARTRELAEANRELEWFSYSISHDLRAPLRGIEYFTQALEEEYGDRLDAQGRDYVTRVRRESARLGRLVRDLLSISRLGRGKVRRRRVDVTGIARAVLDELARTNPDRRVEATVEEGLVANADPRLVRAVLENLIGNAWKFTANEADARITVGARAEDGTRAFFVADNGAGFDERQADRLFAPFQRLHAESEFPGTGVGLASVQRIVHRHGGRVWAEGRPGEGATFHFTLERPETPLDAEPTARS